jgi:hypothetical protein
MASRSHTCATSDAVFGAADVYAPDNYSILTRPRTTFQNDDGRNHCSSAGARATSSRRMGCCRATSAPESSTGANMETVRRSLKPGELAIQRLGSNAWTLRTFTSVFPYATYWTDAAVGSNQTKLHSIRRGSSSCGASPPFVKHSTRRVSRTLPRSSRCTAR